MSHFWWGCVAHWFLQHCPMAAVVQMRSHKVPDSCWIMETLAALKQLCSLPGGRKKSPANVETHESFWISRDRNLNMKRTFAFFLIFVQEDILLIYTLQGILYYEHLSCFPSKIKLNCDDLLWRHGDVCVRFKTLMSASWLMISRAADCRPQEIYRKDGSRPAAAWWQWATPRQWWMWTSYPRNPEMWTDWLQFRLSTVSLERWTRRQGEKRGFRMLFQDSSICQDSLSSGTDLEIGVEEKNFVNSIWEKNDKEEKITKTISRKMTKKLTILGKSNETFYYFWSKLF